ncbi:MAG: CAP domain-containing protein [Patescibacteria group bacterium]
MLSWLKDHFIPHEGNDHHPHMLRTEAIVFLLAVAITVEGTFLVSTFVIKPGQGLFSLILPNVLVQSANASRTNENLPILVTNSILEQAATLKAQDMASKGYFAHTSPEGVTPWYWLQKAGYGYTAAGENLAVNFIDSSDVHTAWMNSPSHRANIMNGGYTEIGIATAKGMYQGNEAIFVVQYFGKPRSSSRIVVSPQRVEAAATTFPSPSPMAKRSPTAIPALAQPNKVQPSSILTTVVIEPRKTTNNILLIIGGIVLLAFVLTIIIRFELPNPRLAIAPMLLILVVLTVLAINRYIGLGLALS